MKGDKATIDSLMDERQILGRVHPEIAVEQRAAFHQKADMAKFSALLDADRPGHGQLLVALARGQGAGREQAAGGERLVRVRHVERRDGQGYSRVSRFGHPRWRK